MVIIAKFSKIRAFGFAAFHLALGGLLLSIWLPSEGQSLFEHIQSDERLHRPLVMLGLLLSPILIFIALTVIQKILFQKCRAIWIHDGRIFFLNFYGALAYSSLPLKNVKRFSIGSMGDLRPRGIIAELENGDKQSVPTILLSEPREVILSRVLPYLTN